MDNKQTDSINNPLHAPVQLDAVVPLAPGVRSSEERWQLHLGWRIVLTVLLLLGLCLLGLLGSSPPSAAAAPLPAGEAQSSRDPLVFAFYYTWFDENTWTYDKLSDLPAQTYVSRDRAVMGRHIDEAKRAGIDAFLVAWYGPENNQTEPNLAALLEEAAARDFKIGILFETDSPFLGGASSIVGALQHAGASHMNHPAYVRVDGRPVVFFWRPHIYDTSTWQTIRNQADAGYGQIWISEGVNTQFLSVFDGHHLYSNTWNPPADLTYTNQKFANLVQSAREQFGGQKYWVSTVMPGYDDTRIRPGYGFAKDREGGAYYVRSWQAAIASNPNWIVINSFNEWPEGSYIEPSAAHGDHYINLTAEWSGQYKSGGAQTVAASAPAPQLEAPAAEPAQPTQAPTPVPTPTPAPDGPTAYVLASLLNVRAGPSTDTALVAQVPQGEALPVVDGQPEWWQILWNGQRGWVYAPLVETALIELLPESATDVTVAMADTTAELSVVDGAEDTSLGATSETVAPIAPPPTVAQMRSAQASPTVPSPAVTATAVPSETAVVVSRSGTGATATVLVSLLNVRSAPSTEAPVLVRLAADTSLPVTGIDPAQPEWVQVDAGTSRGWVYAELVEVDVALDQLPVVEE